MFTRRRSSPVFGQRLKARLVKRLEKLGVKVTVEVTRIVA